MTNFFKSVLCVILSLVLWLLGAALLNFVVLGLLALIIDHLPNLRDLTLRFMNSDFFVDLFPVIVRGLPMALCAWVTSKILNDSKKCYLISCLVTFAIIIILQIRGLIAGDEKLWWFLLGAGAQLFAIFFIKSERYD